MSDTIVFTDKEERVIYIHDDINNQTMGNACYSLLFLLQNDNKKEEEEKNFIRKPIKIFINSNGGIVQDAWSLINIISKSKTPIYTYSTGYAHSCGFLIFIAGNKRFITENTFMLYHQPLGGSYGTFQDMKEYNELFEKHYEILEKFVLERTKISKEKLTEIREKKLDWTIFGEDLIKYGVATDMISNF